LRAKSDLDWRSSLTQSNQRIALRAAIGVQLPVDSRAKTPGATGDRSATITALRSGWRAILDDGEIRSRVGLALVLLGLGAVAFRRLLVFQTDRSLTTELEEFFFIASETSPGVIVLFSLWLLLRQREHLLALPRHAGPAALWISLAVGAAVCLAWATFTGAAELSAPALALTLLAVAVSVRGTAALRVVWLPALFLLFAVPIPAPLLSEILFQLQLWSADLSGALLLLLDLPARVSGDRILMPSRTFVFIEGCSGIRSVVTLSMLSILMLDLFRRRGWHAALVLLAAPVVALGLNSVRAVLLILNPHAAIATVHHLQGVAILLAGLAVLYLFDGLLERGMKQPSEGASGAANPHTIDVSNASGLGLWRDWASAGAMLAGLAAVSIWVPMWDSEPLPNWRIGSQSRPPLPGHWSEGVEQQGDRIYMLSVGVREALHRRYFERSRGRLTWVDVYIAIGDHSTRTATPFSPKTGIPGGGWIIESQEVTSLGRAGPTVVVRQIRRGKKRRLIYHWYEGSTGFGDEVFRALLALDYSPFRRPEASVVVRLGTHLTSTSKADRRRAERRLRRFIRDSRELRAWAVAGT
jgi:exosortase